MLSDTIFPWSKELESKKYGEKNNKNSTWVHPFHFFWGGQHYKNQAVKDIDLKLVLIDSYTLKTGEKLHFNSNCRKTIKDLINV